MHYATEIFKFCIQVAHRFCFGATKSGFRSDVQLIMPPTLKKLMGHIAFGVCVSGCVGGSHFLYLL